MRVIRTIKEMREHVNKLTTQGKSIGFVPTMGFLHKGHESLIKNARSDNDIVVVSIFVNPLQFGPNEDFDRYPKDEEHDLNVAEQASVDIVFLPGQSEMYPNEQSIRLQVVQRTDVLCGRNREGHFAGVGTVLTKLFNIVQPNKVYFGLKDAQQIAVVDALIKDLSFPIELIPVATVRENDGLAKSSRNVNLQQSERENAPFIYQGLQRGRQLVIDGEKNPDKIVEEVKHFIQNNSNGKIEYVELLNFPELTPVTQVSEQVIVAVAVQYKRARLIDNLVFNSEGIVSVTIK